MKKLTPLLSCLLAIIACSCTQNSQAETSRQALAQPAPSDTDSLAFSARCNAERPSAQEAFSSAPLRLALVGDIMMGTTFPDDSHGAFLPAKNGAMLFADCDSLLRSADIAAGNLEGTLLDSGGTPKKCRDPKACYIFRTPTAYVRNLTDAGFDFLGVANNHANDFGAAGVASTVRTLQGAGIAYAGLKAGPRTATLVRDGRRIGLAAFGHSAGTMSIHDLQSLRSTVSQLKKSHDIVVVSFHGGAEGPKYSHVPHGPETAFGEPRGDVEKFAHAAVDAGADIVYGHGPHVPRAAELYKDRLILYSLGNFCTPYRVSLNGASGLAPLVEVDLAPDGRFLSGQIHSFRQQKGVGPRLDTTHATAREIRRLSAADFPASPLRISPDGRLFREPNCKKP